jgi:hypothetical protein
VSAVDRNAVRRGDTITYVNVAGDGEASGQVEFATASAVHILTAGERGPRYPIDWRRVTGHQPKEATCPA